MAQAPEAVELAVERWRAAGEPAQKAVGWRRDAWLEEFPEQRAVLEALPDELDRRSVERIIGTLPETEAGVVSAFVATLAWGYGDNGYGPQRAARILARDEGSVPRRLLEATKAVRADGPLAGYSLLVGPARIKHLGPAFGTKFLFFQSPHTHRALILDRLMSTWLDENCDLRLVTKTWSTPSYETYLRTMEDWAGQFDLAPATLESILFTEQASIDGGQWGASAVTDSVLARSGDPAEFDDELSVEVVGVGETRIDVAPGLLRKMLADPQHVAELLAVAAVERFADRAQRDVRLIRERNQGVSDRQLAVYFKKKYSRAARWEGAGTGMAGILGLPADLALLGWIQSRLVLSIAATYRHDMTDHRERAVELLMIQGAHNSREVARQAITSATQRAVTKLVIRHLRKRPLTVVKQLFRVVGITFTRKAFVEKGIPLVAIPLSAGVNEASTRLLANQAIRFYDTEVK